jgi:TonB family protein
MRFFRTLTISIALSLFLHLMGGLVLSLIDPTWLPSQPVKRDNRTIVELVELPDANEPLPSKDAKSIVRQTDVPKESLTEKDRKARFLSERDQTVLEEQRARNSGMTANRNGQSSEENSQGAPPIATRQASLKGRKLDLAPKSPLEKIPRELAKNDNNNKGQAEKLPYERDGDIAVGGLAPKRNERPRDTAKNESRPLDLPAFPGKNGASTVGEQLPSDIKFGNFTALNTDRYLYYSFYARVEEQVRHRWVKYVRSVLYSYQNSKQKISGNESWTTQIEIVLDKNGIFQKAILHGSSGLKGLDTAPVQAFREAKQIPNPPVEMVKNDGTIRLMYEFNVNFIPQYAAGE